MGRRKKKGRPVSGWLILDKHKGMTSTQAVGKAKRLFNAQKAGHAGTLDPLATGILPIAFGEATKTMSYAVDGPKAYRFTIRWGIETTTDDTEGETTQQSDTRPLVSDVEDALDDFIGEIEQVPPQYSAIKVAGERAYDLARDGETVDLKPRLIVIDDLRLVEQPDDDHVVLEAECGKGTYVRAIARDLGRKLGCYGHVTDLRRLRVGPFLEESAVTFADLDAEIEDAQEPGADSDFDPVEDKSTSEPATSDPMTFAPGTALGNQLDTFLQPCEFALTDLTEVTLQSGDAASLTRGQAVLMRGRDAPIFTGPFYATCRGRIIAIGEADKGTLRPTRVFNLA
ncbi:MAG: tRNA pseudouridine(55) synthase TruB [Planctomycetota bacterium]